MKRNYGLQRKSEVDPSVRRFFPWGLFLVLAALLLLGTCDIRAHAEEDVWACYGSARYQAMYSNWPTCDDFCGKVKSYMQMHTEAEARAAAAEKHLPEWLIKKAEKCL